MNDLPVFFTALAEEDLDHIEDYIAAHDPDAAARLRAAIVQQSIQLGKTPEKGMVLKNPCGEKEIGVRLWPVSHYRNYLILYKIEPEQIRVLRILNAGPGLDTLFCLGWAPKKGAARTLAAPQPSSLATLVIWHSPTPALPA